MAKFPPIAAAWSLEPSAVLTQLNSRPGGLDPAEAKRRLGDYGPNALVERGHEGLLRRIGRELASPLVLLLLFAATISAIAGEWTDTAVVFCIVFITSGVGAWREYDASRAIDRLRERVHMKIRVLRGGAEPLVAPAVDLVPGDVLVLGAGSLIAADAVVLDAHDFFVSEAVLTGETFPVEKVAGASPADAPLSKRRGMVFLGTTVRSGSASAVVVHTGATTEFGKIAGKLAVRRPETEFARGMREFGSLLMHVMFVMTFTVLALNLAFHKPPVESLLFAIALAVGLTPELLPAILTVNLSRSATKMAEAGVLVRRLDAIENFGSMTVLCTDKTGTLTEGVVTLDAAVDEAGTASDRVRHLAFINAKLQTGIPNPLDEAIVAACADQVPPTKNDEIPYDFVRKCLSIVYEEAGEHRMVTKGAVLNVLSLCSGVDAVRRKALVSALEAYSTRGFRVLAVASRVVEPKATYHHADEQGLDFEGFLLFQDPPKTGVREAIAALGEQGVRVKMITGDNVYVARHLAELVGLPVHGVVTGAQLDDMKDEALWHRASETDIFAEVDPNQKERVILALAKMGHVVGYMGDGINDAPALHAADVSISVESAVDVAKEAADFVLLRPDLSMLHQGIVAGRRTFANTLKYVLTTTSANLGNMLSMAVASVVLPFFPLTAGQILLNNFLSDIPALSIASDDVDPEWVDKPQRWDMRFIRRFMVRFGLLSSVFDLMTFAALYWGFSATAETFRTGWFVESLLTELAVALVVRTRRSAWKSRPGKLLLRSSIVVAVLAIAIPYLPFVAALGFVPLPASMMLTVIGITTAYVLSTEALKTRFYAGLGRPDEGPRVPTTSASTS